MFEGVDEKVLDRILKEILADNHESNQVKEELFLDIYLDNHEFNENFKEMKVIGELMHQGKDVASPLIKEALERLKDLAAQKAEQIKTEYLPKLKEVGQNIAQEMVKEYLPLMEDFFKNLTGEIKGKAFGEEVLVLDVAKIVSLSKEYMVANSNEVVAIKTATIDGYFVYLAYSKDKHLLPDEKNKYIIIKANALAKDVEELFGKSEIVILK